jgi:uncharacterized protein (DUF488 family)
MNDSFKKIAWTIGHSTRTIEDLVAMLQSFGIAVVVDVRSYPGSRRYPQFNKEALDISLGKNNIRYFHIKDLGGRRKSNPESKNTKWRNDAFRGFADYMETDSFKKGVEQLQSLATSQRTAYMCSEAVWWRCHRSLISDYLKSIGWTVIHIMDKEKAEEHPYTSAARIVNGKLSYQEDPTTGELFGNEEEHF